MQRRGLKASQRTHETDHHRNYASSRVRAIPIASVVSANGSDAEGERIHDAAAFSLPLSRSLSLSRARAYRNASRDAFRCACTGRACRFDARNAIARCILRELIAPELCYSVKPPLFFFPVLSSPTWMDRCNVTEADRGMRVNVAPRQLCPREN